MLIGYLLLTSRHLVRELANLKGRIIIRSRSFRVNLPLGVFDYKSIQAKSKYMEMGKERDKRNGNNAVHSAGGGIYLKN